MKIAYLGIKGLPSKSGADRVVEAIVRRLAEQHKITVYCSSRYTPPEAHVDGVRLIRLPALSGKHTHMTSVDFLAAWHAVLYGDYDLIHLHHIEASFVLPILKLKYQVITTAHGRITAGNKWGKVSAGLMQFMELPYAKLSDVPTSVSLPHAQQLGTQFNREILYLPNGVDTSPEVDLHAARDILQSKQIPEREYIVFAAGRIIPLKGLHLLLEAFNELQSTCRLVVIGDLSHSPEYAERVTSIANSRVIFIPFVSSQAKLFGLIKLSKLFVFPSITEAMSMMLLEAVSLGIPILCSDIPANTTVLPEKALYFTSGSVSDLRKTLQWALENPQKMATMAVDAKRWVHDKYSWDTIAEEYDNLYNRVSSSLFFYRERMR